MCAPLVGMGRFEQGQAGGLHYLLRVPLQGQGVGRARGDASRARGDASPAPLLLFLHGSGERGSDDGSELSKVRKHGPWRCIGAAQFFILAPQCPRGRVWPAFVDEVLRLLASVCNKHVVDKARVYITGLSMGAFGAWSVAASQPQVFAAIVPVCGGFVGAGMSIATTLAQMLRFATGLHECTERLLALEQFKGVPVWFFHGMKDTIVDPKGSEEVFDALGGASNDKVRKTVYPNVGHACWRQAYGTLELYAWLLTHSKSPSLRESVVVPIPEPTLSASGGCNVRSRSRSPRIV